MVIKLGAASVHFVTSQSADTQTAVLVHTYWDVVQAK